MIFTIQNIPHNILCCAITANEDTADVLLPVPEILMKCKNHQFSLYVWLFKVVVWLQCFWDIHWFTDLHTFLQI